jgi:hypothetical protein
LVDVHIGAISEWHDYSCIPPIQGRDIPGRYLYPRTQYSSIKTPDGLLVVLFDDDLAICDNWINLHPSQLFSGFSLYKGALYGRGVRDD